MGKAPFIPPATQAAKPVSAKGVVQNPVRRGQMAGSEGITQTAPLPAAMTRAKPGVMTDFGSTERASPKQGLVQRDGNRAGQPANPPSPPKASVRPQVEAHHTGMERAMMGMDNAWPKAKSSPSAKFKPRGG